MTSGEVPESIFVRKELQCDSHGSTIYVQEIDNECNEHGLAGVVDCITVREKE